MLVNPGAVPPPAPATVLVTDVERFGLLTNPQQLATREHLYALLGTAFDSAGVPLRDCPHEDRGDGVLVVVPAAVPKALLLGVVVGRLAELSERAGWPRLGGQPPVRLRAAVHAGDVHHDGRGFVGADVNHAFRLAGSPVLHLALERARTNCAVLVSDALYHGTVRHGYGGLDPARFHPATVAVKETRTTGWLWIPGDDGRAREVAAASTTGRPRPAPAGGGVRLAAAGHQQISGGVVAGRDAHTGRGAPRRRRRRG